LYRLDYCNTVQYIPYFTEVNIRWKPTDCKLWHGLSDGTKCSVFCNNMGECF